MRDSHNNKEGLAILGLLIIICLTFTVLPGWIPLLRKRWVLLALAFVITIIISSRYYSLKYMSAWYFYIFAVLLNSLFADAYFVNIIGTSFELFKWIIPPAFFYYATQVGDLKYSKAVLLSIAFIVVFEGISTLSLDLINPGIIRNVAVQFVLEDNHSVFYPYYRIGMASYSFAHAVSIMIPPLVYVVKDDTNKKVFRFASFFLVAMCLVLNYLSGSTTALILGITALLLSLFSKKGGVASNARVIIIVLILIVPFIFSDALTFELLNALDNLLGGTHFHSKVLDFMDMASYGEASGDIKARENLYVQSLDLWLRNPLFGSNEMPGRHSAFLDRLASLGLFGVIPLIMFIYEQIKYTSKTFSSNAKVFYYEGLLIGLLLLLLKDTDDWETFLMLFLILPLIIWANDCSVFKKKVETNKTL